jgi:hypothetical protein
MRAVAIGSSAEQQHVRLDCEAARDTQALLLPTRERKRRLLELVLDFVPEG